MKKNCLKKILATMSVFLVFVLAGNAVFAETAGDSLNGNGDDNYSEWDNDWSIFTGKCGDAIDWTLDKSVGALTIKGTGDMWSRTSHEEEMWDSSEVKSVAFSGNLTSIGAGCFSGSTQLLSVELPRTLGEVGENAFEGCTALKTVELVNTLGNIGSNCFAGCDNLRDVYFTGSEHDWLFLTDGVETGLASDVNMHYRSTISVVEMITDIKASAGDTVTFSVKAQGLGTLRYQWYYRKKGAAVWSLWKGHTTAETTAVANDTWGGMQVYCRIEDSQNYFSTQSATITLLTSAKILIHPSDIELNIGKNAVFSIVAHGTGLKYQWYYKKAGVNIWNIWKGHTTSSTSAVVNDTWDGMQVYCKVSDSFGANAYSKPATVKLVGMPMITLQPSNVSLRIGSNVKFSVRAQGSNLKYQWYYMKKGVTYWSKWNGHTTATTGATSNASWDGMKVYCKITDGFGRTVSSKSAIVKLIR